MVFSFIRSLKRAIILADSFDAPKIPNDNEELNTNHKTIETNLLKTKYAEKLALHNADIGNFTFNRKIIYLNMSSYKLFFN